MSWWLRKETCVECVIFPYHFKGEGILLKCRNNRRKTAMVYWHTGCKSSYRPQTIYFWNNQPIYIYRLIISKINNDIDDWKSWKNLFQLESSLLKEEFILIKKKKLWIYPTEIKNKKTNWKGQIWNFEVRNSSTVRHLDHKWSNTSAVLRGKNNTIFWPPKSPHLSDFSFRVFCNKVNTKKFIQENFIN